MVGKIITIITNRSLLNKKTGYWYLARGCLFKWISSYRLPYFFLVFSSSRSSASFLYKKPATRTMYDIRNKNSMMKAGIPYTSRSRAISILISTNLAYIVMTRDMYAIVMLLMVLFHINSSFYYKSIFLIFLLKRRITTMATTAISKVIRAMRTTNIGILKFSRMLPDLRPDVSLAFVI